ncbi:MAG: hypothetical protein AB1489_06865 [Acidobacteriota bacterium]
MKKSVLLCSCLLLVLNLSVVAIAQQGRTLSNEDFSLRSGTESSKVTKKSPVVPGFEDVAVGQRYIYLLSGDMICEEEIIDLNTDEITYRITLTKAATKGTPATSPPSTVERRIPLKIATFLKKYRPDFNLATFGEIGYTTEYFENHMASFPYSHAFPSHEFKETRQVKISNRSFSCRLYRSHQMAMTLNGCIDIHTERQIAEKYPFTIKYESNGSPVVILQQIK